MRTDQLGLFARPYRKPLVFFLLALGLSAIANAQLVKSSSRPQLVNDGMLGMDCSVKDRSEAWIVGSYGKMLCTTNGGLTWQRVQITDEKLNSVAFTLTSNRFWAVGEEGVILKQNEGKDWSKYEGYAGTSTFWGIDFSVDGQRGLIVGQNGIMLSYTGEGSNSWKELNPLKSTLYGTAFSRDGTTAVVFGENASLSISNEQNFGVWTSLLKEEDKRTIGNASVYSGWISGDGKTVIAGAANGYFINVDIASGRTIASRLARGGIRSLTINPDTGIGWAVSTLGEIFKTEDAGKSWTLEYTAEGETYLTSVSFAPASNFLMVVGDNGIILNLKNGEWLSNFTRTLYDVITIDGNTFVAGSKGVYRLGGNDSLTTISPAESKETFYALWLDQGWVWACGTNSVIYKFRVDGNDWSLQHKEQKGAALKSIYVDQKNEVGLAVGENGTLLAKLRGEQKWAPVKDQDVTVDYNDLWCEGRTCVIAGSKGVVRVSADAGKHWQDSKGIPSNIEVEEISFSPTHSIGYAVGICSNKKADNHIFFTNDAGKNWKPDLSFETGEHLAHVTFGKDDSTRYITTVRGDIYKSSDSGTNWFQLLPTYTTQTIWALAENDKGEFYAVGANGLLFKPSPPDLYPKVQRFLAVDSLDYVKLDIVISDLESKPENLTLKLVVDGNVLEGVDKSLLTQEVTYDEKAKLKAIPKSILNKDNFYKIRLFVSDGWNVTTAEKVLEVKETLVHEIAAFAHWDRAPKSFSDVVDAVKANLLILLVLYTITLFGLYFISPLSIFYWQEFLAQLKLPLSDKTAPWLVMLLPERPRVLNAFVTAFSEKAEKHFRNSDDVSTRPYWVAAPFSLDGIPHLSFAPSENQSNYIAGLDELRNHLDEERVIISIDGPGGIGKSSLAFQIARWATATTRRKRLLTERALPIFTNKLDSPVDDVCHRKLELITNRTLTSSFVNRLLSTRRVVVVADGVSEMAEFDPKYIDPESGAKFTKFLIMTSRKPINLSVVTRIVPMGLKLDFLDPLLDGFILMYVGAFYFGKQREVIRTKVVAIIEEITQGKEDAMVPLLVLRLAVDKAKRLFEEEKQLAEHFPDSFSLLIDDYIEYLFRKGAEQSELFIDLRKAAMITVGFSGAGSINEISEDDLQSDTAFRPAWVAEHLLLTKIKKSSLDIFITSGLMTESGTKDDRLLKFSYDPVAEYITAKNIAIQRRDKGIDTKQFDKLVLSAYSKNPTLYLMLVSLCKRLRVNLSPPELRIGA